MPNKTLSVRDEDLALWERAERAAKHERTTVSALVASALTEKLGGTDVCHVGVYGDDNSPLHIEAFEGRWLTDAPQDVDRWERPRRRNYDGHYSDWDTFVAETKRGRIAVYCRYYFDSMEHPTLFKVFDSLGAARQALAGDDRIDQAKLASMYEQLSRNGKRGQEVRWRDI